MPRDLCGYPVPTAALEPLLPPGEKITLRSKDLSAYRRCTLVVDGERSISGRIVWNDKDSTVKKVAVREDPYTDLVDVISTDQSYAYSEKGGVSEVVCPDPELAHRRDMQMHVVIIAHDDLERDGKKVRELLLSYRDALAQSADCRGNTKPN
ncbi:hypothetical protein AB0G74_07075 [Streptomyces sp. NPDC020875]|uniref:hypothetical protein n=1 Tax=Streptomyces sp. NPDC020875 TaxID=3154898 RepID=UPI0033E493E9